MPFYVGTVTFRGDVYSCCQAHFKKPYIFGNLNEQNFEQIWYGQKAKYLRNKIINKDYSLCDLDKHCNINDNVSRLLIDTLLPGQLELDPPPFPVVVILSLDWVCNFACVTCRDRVYMKEGINYIALPHKGIYEALQNCQVVVVEGSGELFASKVSQNVVQDIVNKFPNMQFVLHTNGSLSNEKNISLLFGNEYLKKLYGVEVSVHSCTDKVHRLFTRTNTFEAVRKNLEWFSYLKRSGKIKIFILVFVVTDVNYYEMPMFVSYANSLKCNIEVSFWNYRKWNNICDFDSLNILDPSHPEHRRFKAMMIRYKKIFSAPHVHLCPILRTYIKEESD
jgi:radical SAM protein with 4Fe4S-binding SPASM domain